MVRGAGKRLGPDLVEQASVPGHRVRSQQEQVHVPKPAFRLPVGHQLRLETSQPERPGQPGPLSPGIAPGHDDPRRALPSGEAHEEAFHG